MVKTRELKIDNKDSEIIRVHRNFKKRVEKFIKDFEINKGIVISSKQATKIIDDKIEKQGGLKI